MSSIIKPSEDPSSLIQDYINNSQLSEAANRANIIGDEPLKQKMLLKVTEAFENLAMKSEICQAYSQIKNIDDTSYSLFLKLKVLNSCDKTKLDGAENSALQALEKELSSAHQRIEELRSKILTFGSTVFPESTTKSNEDDNLVKEMHQKLTSEDFDGALDIAKSITNETKKNEMVEYVTKATTKSFIEFYIVQGSFQEAIQSANNPDNNFSIKEKEEILNKIQTAEKKWVESGRKPASVEKDEKLMQEAIEKQSNEIADKISDKLLKEETKKSIVKFTTMNRIDQLLEKLNFSEAKEVLQVCASQGFTSTEITELQKKISSAEKKLEDEMEAFKAKVEKAKSEPEKKFDFSKLRVNTNLKAQNFVPLPTIKILDPDLERSDSEIRDLQTEARFLIKAVRLEEAEKVIKSIPPDKIILKKNLFTELVVAYIAAKKIDLAQKCLDELNLTPDYKKHWQDLINQAKEK